MRTHSENGEQANGSVEAANSLSLTGAVPLGTGGLGGVAVLIPATVLGVGVGPAVVVHEGSTLIVVANALLLLGLRDATSPEPTP